MLKIGLLCATLRRLFLAKTHKAHKILAAISAYFRVQLLLRISAGNTTLPEGTPPKEGARKAAFPASKVSEHYQSLTVTNF